MNNLKQLRAECNLSQSEFADVFGLSKSCISKYEQGTRQMDISTLIRIADYFDKSTDYVLGREKNEVQVRPDQDLAKKYAKYEDLIMLYDALDVYEQHRAMGILQALVAAKHY